jgi:D-alanyl-D-alanine carboxypeptidase
LSIKYLLPEEIKAPVEKNQKIGELAVYINSIHVYSVPLISLETVKQKSFMDNIFLIIKQWLSI